MYMYIYIYIERERERKREFIDINKHKNIVQIYTSIYTRADGSPYVTVNNGYLTTE